MTQIFLLSTLFGLMFCSCIILPLFLISLIIIRSNSHQASDKQKYYSSGDFPCFPAKYKFNHFLCKTENTPFSWAKNKNKKTTNTKAKTKTKTKTEEKRRGDEETRRHEEDKKTRRCEMRR